MNMEQDKISDSFMVGCWQLDDRSWKALSEIDVERTIGTYLAWGIKRFDTADIYGRSEKLLGKCLKGRSDCEIWTKAVFFGAVPTLPQIQYKIDSSLRNLQRDHLDCVQIHWHDPSLDFASTFEVFNQYLESGKIRQLGVTNFNTAMLKRALEYAPIKTHQVQYNLIDRRVETSMQALCLQHKIPLIAYGSLAGGFLSNRFLGVKIPPAEGEHCRGFYYNHMIAKHGGWSAVQELLQTMAEVAQKNQLTIAQVALNWLNQQPGIGAILLGLTENRQQIKTDLEALKMSLDPIDIQKLSKRSQELFQQVGDIYSYERQ
ncbi:aldo/keto reductase [Spirulina subsalsa]|uniref:aldo/keto reductase n=1 Tax=Spirulina subsalsa TaxID=54311 RepID=UPI00192C3FAC|nr:aldo/keto reductase [Spirulina subsalsa]